MHATEIAGTHKVRRAVVLGGLGPACDHVVHNSSFHNNLVGVCERMIFAKGTEPPQPRQGLFPRVLQPVTDFFLRERHFALPWDDETLLSHTRPHKVKVTLAAINSLCITAVCKADSFVRGFCKAEKTFAKDAAPRIIQPRDPRYVVAVARFLKGLEGPIYELLAKLWGGPTVMKGYNATQTASHLREMWDGFADPVAVGLDASRFDQHVSSEALKWEHSIYKMFFSGKHLQELKKLLGWQVSQKGTFRTPDGLIRFKIEGGRASGDINTALGNCLIMCSLVYAFCKQRKVRARLANNGDDCVLFLERSDLQKLDGLNDWFLEMGFNMKREDPVYVFEHVVFCQTQPVWASTEWRMTRQFPNCLRKDTMMLDVTPDQARERIAAIGHCGMAVAAGVPCLQSIYTRMASVGLATVDESVGYGFRMMSKGLSKDPVTITDEARLSFWLAFGVTPTAQEAFEAWMPQLDVVEHIIDFPLSTCHSA